MEEEVQKRAQLQSGRTETTRVIPASSTTSKCQKATENSGKRQELLIQLRTGTSSNLFLVSLALADLMVALYPYPLTLVAIFHDGWALGEVHCKASDFVMGLSVIGSVFNLTAIAINRYFYICPSVAYHQICRRWHTSLYICLI
ncbi:Melatonin receptor type 1B [Vulpes lagopus]